LTRTTQATSYRDAFWRRCSVHGVTKDRGCHVGECPSAHQLVSRRLRVTSSCQTGIHCRHSLYTVQIQTTNILVEPVRSIRIKKLWADFGMAFADGQSVFIARQHTDARYWYSKSVHLSVRPSVCPLHSGIRWKRLNISSYFFHHAVAQSFWFYQRQTSSRNYEGSPLRSR